MSTARVSEGLVEDVLFADFAAAGVEVRGGAEVDRAGERPNVSAAVLHKRAWEATRRLNPLLEDAQVDAIVRSLARAPHATLVENNRWLHRLLIEGVPVEFRDPESGETRGMRARLIDFEDPENNDFLVVRQFTIQGENGRLVPPDAVLFVNGLPLVIVELKDPADVTADLNVAIDQLYHYRAVAPDLFTPNLLLIVSDGLLTRVGSITSERQRFSAWRPARGGEPTLDAVTREATVTDSTLRLHAVMRRVRRRRAWEYR